MVVLTVLFVAGWVAVALLGTQAYFLGEQSKPIHERNWRSGSFERLAAAITGQEIDYADRVPAFITVDAYDSRNLPNR